MSPDNILLPGGSIDKAKIIDFGIAKNLDASARTSIGDGFAGKIGFAAPEQFGAFGRKIGPWTDIYSVALVGLAFANRRPINMGADPFEALERRKQGPDLSALPAPLRPVFAKMLANDPADRPQDMATVLGIFAGLDKGHSAVEPKSQTLFGLPKVAALGILGLVGMIAMAGAALWLIPNGSGIDEDVPSETTSDPNTETAVVPAAPVEAPMESILGRTSNVIANQSCTLLNASIGSNRNVELSGAALEPSKLAANLSGVIGDPSVSFNAGKVVPVTSDFCPFVDFIRSSRTRPPSGMAAVRVPQSVFTLNGTRRGGCNANTAEVITTLQPRQPDFTVLGVVDGKSPSVTLLFESRAGLESTIRSDPGPNRKINENTYEFTLCPNAVGKYGVVLIEGIGPFDIDLPDLRQEGEKRIEDSTWVDPIAEKSKERGWTADSVWFEVK
jgi:serine/threonine-protein kinase